jgi:alkylhydroperoxidase/carboxymuconolactone decarboxylase family protein YurZ
MEVDMFENLNQIRKARKKFNLKMFRSGVSTFHELEELEANAFRDGVIEQKYKELIALGISISHGCYG